MDQKIVKERWNNFFKVFTIIIIILLIVTTAYLFLTLQSLEQFKPIATLTFPESEWIKINSAQLFTPVRTNVIFPNDQIILVLNITNNKPLLTEVKPYFYTIVGGNLVDAQERRGIVFGHNHTSTISTDYYPVFEGLNFVTVALKISYSNGTFLTFQNTTTNFEVLSRSDQAQLEQNYYFVIGVFASSVIGGLTIVALAYSVYYSRKETRLLEYQVRMKERPWISPNDIVGMWVTFENGITIPFKDAEDIILEKSNKTLAVDRIYEIIVKNSGSTPAKIRGRIKDNIIKFEQSDLEKMKVNVEPIIMPGESEFFSIKINRKYLMDGGKYYAGILLEYDLGMNRTSKICKIWEITKNTCSRITEEIDDPDMPDKQNRVPKEK
ncbi:MAG: hypothetical protein AABX32_04820 [Nanoarchaeota archaeon]